MVEKILIGNYQRHGKSSKYNRISKEKAFDICGRRLRPSKPPITPKTCLDCYYYDGKCEWGKTDREMCVRFKTDWNFSNLVHRSILHDYEWCMKHFDDFCQLDKECFVAIYGKVNEDGLIEIKKENGDM